MSLTTIGLGVTLLIAGPLSEVVGRTRLIHLSLAASAVVAVACALAPTWEVLLGLRLLQGVTLAGLPAVATAYLREELHASTHARAAGVYIGGTAIGGMTGRLVTGPIAEVATGGGRWPRSPPSAWSAPSSSGCCSRPRGTSSPRRRRLRPLAARTRRALADPPCWRCMPSPPARSARSWRSSMHSASG